jgi:Proteasome assembly chaperone 4
MEPSTKPITLSLPVPKHPHLLFHAHLTILAHCTMVHLTTSTLGESGSTTASLGSFVYAMPDRLNPRDAISTALSTTPANIEYATRLAKILARKLNRPVYVGCSIYVEGMTVEEEMEGLKAVVGKIGEAVEREESRAESS